MQPQLLISYPTTLSIHLESFQSYFQQTIRYQCTSPTTIPVPVPVPVPVLAMVKQRAVPALRSHITSTIQMKCRARLLCNLSEYKTTAARFRQGVDSSSQTPPNSLPAVLRLRRWPPPCSRRIGFPPLGWPPDERPGPPFSALLRYLSPTENQPTGLQAYMPACRPRKVDVIQPRQPLRPQTQVLRRGTLPLLQSS